ncbi:MAG: tRNA (adenosine(37)-N6)-threonylcarbamoyltransferase complex dimerization subunit type 1 TsaB [Pseudomonadota bacterium]
MHNFLALDCSTDTLSIAVRTAGALRSIHRCIPKQHHQQLFALLEELLAYEEVRDQHLDALAYGSGPGSFTGLRIAVSFIQGLGYSLRLPVVGISSLLTQANTALRLHPDHRKRPLLSTIDARIGQVYAQWFANDDGELHSLGDAVVCRPEELAPPSLPVGGDRYLAVGSGSDLLPASLDVEHAPGLNLLCPHALDMLDEVERSLHSGGGQQPAEARPQYVQRELPWKKLADQGLS